MKRQTIGVLCALAIAACIPGTAAAQVSHYHTSFTIDGVPLTLSIRGTVELTGDGLDVASLGPDGEMTLSEGTWLRRLFLGGASRLVIRTAPDGSLEREYYAGGRLQPYEPGGAAWFRATLPRLLATGFAAQSRVAQLLKTGGPDEVLRVIPPLQSDYVQAVYFRHLMREADLRGAGLARALAVAGSEISSDYELGQLLREAAERAAGDGAVEQARLEAALTIQSDYEMGRVLREAAEKNGVDGAREAFFAAADTISSDYEHRRVLSTVADAPLLAPETTAALLASARGIASDYELASLLVGLAERHPLDEPLRRAFVATAGSVGSSHERSRALAALVSSESMTPIARDR